MSNLLKKGDSGLEVAILQYILSDIVCDADGNPPRIDGIFGEETEQLIRQIQRRESIAIDGIVGNDTRIAILREWWYAK